MDLSNENILHVKKEGIEYLQFKRLLEFDNLVHCYTLRTNNVDFKGVDNQFLDESYKKICTALDIKKESIVRPGQSHTDCIKNVENSSDFNNVDGLVTNKNGVNLTLSFADCTPILFYDYENKIIGNIHSGWRGTVQKIGPKAVEKMIEDYGSKPENIIACIGPCIGKCHFEVEEDVKNIFEKTFSYLGMNCDIIKKQEKSDSNNKTKYKIDTTLINRIMLQKIGLKPENIIESGVCTVCNSSLIHSFRADKEKSGRNVAILGKRD